MKSDLLLEKESERDREIETHLAGLPLKEFLVLGETVADLRGILIGAGEQDELDESESSASSGLSECRVDIPAEKITGLAGVKIVKGV